MNNILALDVGFRNTGWSVFNNDMPIGKHGVIQTWPGTKKIKIRVADDNARCATEIARSIANIIKEHDIKAAIAEAPSGGAQSAKAMQQMGMALAVTAATLELLDIPVEWVTPAEVKKAAVGGASATKEEVMTACRAQYPRNDWPKAKCRFEHIADACFAYKAAACGGSNLLKIFKTA